MSLHGGIASSEVPEGTLLLNDRIHEAYVYAVESLEQHSDVEPVVFGVEAYGQRPATRFGPVALVVTYQDETELIDLAGLFDRQVYGDRPRGNRQRWDARIARCANRELGTAGVK